MKNIVKLNSEIDKIFNPKIIYYENCNNILFNDFWVSEINYDLYNKWSKRVKKKILKIADLSNLNRIVYLKTFHKDILKKYNTLVQINYQDIEVLYKKTETFVIKPHHIKEPKWTSRDGYREVDELNNKFEVILDKMANFFNIEDWDAFTALQDIEYDEFDIENLILEKSKQVGRDDEHIIDFEKFYSFAHLSYCLDVHRNLLKDIAKFTDNIVKFISKIENNEDGNLNIDDINELDPNNIKLEFKMGKKEIAMLFKNLADFGFIHVDNQGIKTEYSQLKKYINNGNMYFTHNTKIKLVKGINQEFAKVYAFEERPMHINIEKKFLKRLIIKLDDRIKELEIEENG